MHILFYMHTNVVFPEFIHCFQIHHSAPHVESLNYNTNEEVTLTTPYTDRTVKGGIVHTLNELDGCV